MSGDEKVNRYFIDEETTLENTTPEEAYDKIIAWLEGKKAKIKVQNRPFSIKADQGSWLWAGEESEKAKKTFEFILTQSEDKVLLRTIINGPVNTYYNVDEIRRKWLEIVVDLWVELEVKEKPKNVEKLYDPTKLVKEIEKGYRNMFLGISLGFLVFAGMLIVSSFGYETSYMSGIGVIPFMYGIYGYMAARNTKKRLQSQPQGEVPVIIPKITSDKKIIITSLLITILSFGIIGYMVMMPPTLTYSRYGISFSYPLRMTLTESSLNGITISNDVGLINLSSRDEESGGSIMWVKNPAIINPDDVLASIVAQSSTSYTISAVQKTTLTRNDGVTASVLYYSVTQSDQEFDGAAIVWYNSSEEKIYIINFITDGGLNTLVNTVFNSFKTGV